MAERRIALIIASYQYEDAGLRQLVAPPQDAEALARVLSAPAIGGFDVQTLLGEPSYKVSQEIEAFFADRKRHDLLLLYFSGHGIKDEDGQLYFATPNTRRNLLRSTAVSSALVNDVMRRSRSRRQVLLLDCCYSGAFARGMLAKADVGIGTKERFEGQGRVVLTASDAMQYSFEGDTVEGEGVRSIFTRTLVRGLETGEADQDSDGQVSLDELYDYVHDRAVDETPQQRPGKWAFDVQGEIIIARNPRPIVKPVELPPELRQAMESPFAGVREGVVRDLGRLLRGGHVGLAQAAHESLTRLVDDDSRAVSSAAAASLAAYAQHEEIEHERLARESAEQERLAREKEERREREKAEQERTAWEMAEAKSEQSVSTAGRAAVPAKAIGLLVLLTAIGWGLGFVIGAAVADEVYGATGWGFVGAIGGSITGMALRQTESSLQQKKRALMVAGGWAIAGAIGWSLAGSIGEAIKATTNDPFVGLSGGWTAGWAIGWLIGWIFFGTIVGSTLWRMTRSIPQKQVLVIAGGWLIAGAIGWSIPQALADMIRAIGFAISQDAGYTVATAIDRIVAFTGAGAIGGGVMFWQLSRARRST